MRKLILEEWISLDGYVADKNGGLGFFANKVRESYSDTARLNFLESIDCILFGRNTYTQFVNIWPQRSTDGEPLAQKMNSAKKIVFSNTLAEAPWGNWPAAEVASGNAVPVIKRLKALPGKDMMLWGSISLAQTLMSENLIDEYHLHLCPTLTAGGRKLFNGNADATNLRLLATRRFNTDTVLLSYQPISVVQ